MVERGVHLDADHVAAVTVTKPASLNWPFAIDRRLDQLVELANAAGANTRRHELVAALVAMAEPDGEDLLQAVIEWRKRRVRDVVIGVENAAQVVEIARYPPGRRRSAG